MDAMQKLVELEGKAKAVAFARDGAPMGHAAAEICGKQVTAYIVPNTRGFTKRALIRTDWYVNGKRISSKNLRAALGAA